MSTFADPKFAFQSDPGEFCQALVREKDTGVVIARWAYRKGSPEEQQAERDIRGYDTSVYTVHTAPINGTTFRDLLSRAYGSPLISRLFGRQNLATA